MRNWNLRYTSGNPKQIRASRLPMRNWNSTSVQKISSSSRASRLPMRNWNTDFAMQFKFVVHCFQTTYEELKPVYNALVIDIPALPDYLWGIETSFDEFILGHDYHASRLPMRNWNFIWWVHPGPRLPASRLPMRNWNVAPETEGTLKMDASFQTTYEELKPWLFDPVVIWNEVTSFQTTYEELKLVTHQSLGNLVLALPDYLWGIETSLLHRNTKLYW